MKLKPNASTRSQIDHLQQIKRQLDVYQSRESFSRKDLKAIRRLIDQAKKLTTQF